MGITFVARGKPCCINCGAPASEKHHVVPRSLGGLATVHLCSVCHGVLHEMKRAANHRELVLRGLERARAAGKVLGRRYALDDQQHAQVLERLAAGETVYALAKTFNTSRQVIMRVRDAAGAALSA